MQIYFLGGSEFSGLIRIPAAAYFAIFPICTNSGIGRRTTPRYGNLCRRNGPEEIR